MKEIVEELKSTKEFQQLNKYLNLAMFEYGVVESLVARLMYIWMNWEFCEKRSKDFFYT